jgi:hypothetical protein
MMFVYVLCPTFNFRTKWQTSTKLGINIMPLGPPQCNNFLFLTFSNNTVDMQTCRMCVRRTNLISILKLCMVICLKKICNFCHGNLWQTAQSLWCLSCGLDDRGIRVWFMVWIIDFSILHSVSSGSAAQSPIRWILGSLSPRGKVAGAWSWSLISIQCWDQECLSYTCTPWNTIMAWCLIN